MAKWTDYNYGATGLTLARGVMRVVVSWDGGGYKVSCAGRSLKKKFMDIERAKKGGEDLARRIANEMIKDLNLLTIKPMLYLRNVNEKSEAKSKIKEKLGAVEMNIKMEAEFAELSDEDATEYRKDLGFEESGLDRLIIASYKLLDLITFYSASFKNINQAWTIKKGAKAPQAAGVIHSDFEKGFIRVEIINIDKLIEFGSEIVAREKGEIRVEGKDYVMREGDVCNFLFNK